MSVDIAEFNLTWRPRTYFWPRTAEHHLLSTIKGQTRRKIARDAISSGNLATTGDFFLKSSLDEEERVTFGRFHPGFMGGEYLPNRREAEIEIARINIDSTTSDVTSVYARRGKSRIYYRVVDEYQGNTLTRPVTRTSVRPLTLGQLTDFFLGAWPLDEVLEMNELDENEAQAFVNPSSEFYPGFEEEVRERIYGWFSAKEED